MPSSLPTLIFPVTEIIQRAKPKKILDVGVGYGKYGLLAREYLNGKQKIKRLDGVEVFQDYIGPIQIAIYDNLYIEDVRNFKPKTDYDLILLCDVLEHMTIEEGQSVLQKLKGDKIITTPKGFTPQGAECGNEFERHISGWQEKDFDLLKPYAVVEHPTNWIIYTGDISKL